MQHSRVPDAHVFKLLRARSASFILATGVACSQSWSAENTNSPSPAEKKSASAPTHTIKRGVIKSKAQLDAVVESTEMRPVKLEPKAWTDLTVLDAVAHGAKVKKGEVLVRLDPEKITEQIKELEMDQPSAALALEIALAEAENLKQTTPLKLDAARRTQRIADQDYSYFEETGRAQKEKAARFGVKSAEERLANAKEELAQLEKMYRADDLTEETEEIILKRQKFSVESAEYGLESMRLSADQSLKRSIPREEESLKTQKRDQELALALSEQTLPKALARKRLDVEKLKRDQKKAEKKLADLKKDFENFVVHSPMDGIVYYGAWENGKWTTGGSVAKKLVPTAKLSANEVFITVVNPEKLVLKGVIPEGELSRFSEGLKGTASPISASDKKLDAKLEDVGFLPLPGSTGFEASISVKKEKGVRLLPGMSCKVTFADAPRPEAVLAPKDAVFGEGGQKHVFLLKKDATHEKRTVKTGESDDKMIEIAEGLEEGDKILLKKPE